MDGIKTIASVGNNNIIRSGLATQQMNYPRPARLIANYG